MTKHHLEFAYTQARGKKPNLPMKDELEGIYIAGCDPYKDGVGTSFSAFTLIYGTPENSAVQKMDAEVALKRRLPLDTKPVLLLKQKNDEHI